MIATCYYCNGPITETDRGDTSHFYFASHDRCMFESVFGPLDVDNTVAIEPQ